MPLTLSGTGGITYPDGTVNATRAVNTAGDTMTGGLNVPNLNIGASISYGGLLSLTRAQTSSLAKLATFRDSGAGTLFEIESFGDPATGTANRISYNSAYLAIRRDGAEQMRIDSSGRLTMPLQPAFFAYNSSTFSGTGTVPFDQTAFNRGNCYNTSTYRFTAPVSGVYWFNVLLATQVATTWQLITLNINGGRNRDLIEAISVPINGEFHSSTIATLSAGDYVTINSESGNLQGGISNYYSGFQGYLIG